jgi:hypothetical protein
MRLYTACTGSERVLTVNAHDHEEAREALSVLLGEMGELSIRTAASDEVASWCGSAADAGAR